MEHTRKHPIWHALAWLLALLLMAGGGYFAWKQLQPEPLPAWLAMGNGRFEATEVDVASKIAGRLVSVQPHEGDSVEAGQEVARLDVEDLSAQLKAAEARTAQARASSREAGAGIRKAQSDVVLADKTLQRSEELVKKGFVSGDKLDRDRSTQQGMEASMAAARSKQSEADAAIATAQASADAIRATLKDAALRAPINGRVLYRLAEPGEVVAAGGKVLTLVDLTDMYMTIYLPTDKVGQVAIGSEGKILLDGLPDQAIPAKVSFVAPKAQFTPREVETRTEREKLMFRVKVQADPAWLAAHRDLAKAGMPGVAYVRLDPTRPWPDNLQSR